MEIAKLEEGLDKLSIFMFNNIVEKLSKFNHIKMQLDEYGALVSNPIHKLLGKLPSSF